MTQIDGAAARNLQESEPKSPIRLVLVEDHVILRQGVKALLELASDVLIVGEYGCVQSSLDGINALQPDLILVDLSLPNGSGIELLAKIRRLSPRSRKLVLTASDDAEYIRAALGAGADGYVLKDASAAELMLAIRTVSMGQRFLCKAIAGKVLSGFLLRDNTPPPRTPSKSITAREREVLSRVAQGHSNKMIAREFGVSPKTIEKHRSNLMRKLQLHNTASVTMYAIANGLAANDAPEAHAATQLPVLASEIAASPLPNASAPARIS
jgi:DNA-binding NarL/FixJ family response regulator